VNSELATQAAILLVDDDPELLKALSKVLQREGYRVIAKSDAVSAVDYLGDTDERFDLVITDVSMPGMKGTTFLTVLKTAFPDLPVILITAFGDWGQYGKALREGAFDYISKPFDKAELLAVIRRAVNRQPAHNPMRLCRDPKIKTEISRL
jgi:DNA-binding NtrC family response regulator